jgi:phosphoribosylformylglycinamidine synthase
MAKLGLLPEPEAAAQSVTLVDNVGGRFVDRWVRLRAEPESVCLWTRGLDRFELPIAHAEGRFVPGSSDLLRRLEQRGQIALRYEPDEHGESPNGSVGQVAGLCDPTGRVLGLMPHPERCIEPWHHPDWKRRGAAAVAESAWGLALFRNAVEHVASVRRS